MIPVVTPARMGEIDAAAPEPVEVLIDRAAAAVRRAAVRTMGGTYGRRVVVLAGPGNNGADGRVAAEQLERLGVRCLVLDATAPDSPAGSAGLDVDLVIDAAFGTGLRRPYRFPDEWRDRAPVLAVDIPSGVDGATGAVRGEPVAAAATVTFAALKPGLVLEPGRSLVGSVTVADIGLQFAAPDRAVAMWTDADVVGRWPTRPPQTHKWHHAVRVVGGSAAMTGAARLAAMAAQRTGAGYVQLATPGATEMPPTPCEAVGHPLPAQRWGATAVADTDRVAAMVVGPGLGPQWAADPAADEDLADVVRTPVPLVLDGDALRAGLPELLRHRAARGLTTVLTPHDGEWARLSDGMVDGLDEESQGRLDATAAFAAATGAVVLRKGPTTAVAHPDGRVAVITSGSAALATAGTGDVLAGMVAALLAQGLDGFDASACAAHVHGRVGANAAVGLVAGDLPERIGPTVASLRRDRRETP